MTIPTNTFPLHIDAKRPVANLLGVIGSAFAQGNTNLEIGSISSPEDAVNGTMVFINKTGESLCKSIATCQASIFVVSEPICESDINQRCFVITQDPLAWFIKATGILLNSQSLKRPVINKTSYISENATIGSDVSVGIGTVIEAGCIIGDRTIIGAHSFIAKGTCISEEVFIQNHVSIGSVGLGYHIDQNGNRLLFPHLGNVIIGKSVVVGAGTVIVRGQLTDTVIGDYVRLGNLVNVGHNVQIGAGSVLSSNSCVAGGARIGSNCKFGASAVISSKIQIGDDCKVGIGSVVVKDMLPKTSYFGNPAKPLPTMGDF